MPIDYVDFAKRSVDDYVSVKPLDIVEESKQAVDCLNCEAQLEGAITAWRMTMKADEVVRWAIHEGHIPDSDGEEILACIDKLIVAWIGPFDRMLQWIRRCESNSYNVDFKDQFQNCFDEAKAIAKYDPHQPLTAGISRLRDEAIREHENEETREFVPDEK